VVRPAAIVMNMFYTGLGIARSLGERGIRVIGLSAHRDAYGNVTRYAKVQMCPDSREHPEELLAFLRRLAATIPERAILFPTRDADVLFLNRFREELSQKFRLLLPGREALEACLNKWETYRRALAAGIPSARTWHAGSREELEGILTEIRFPCVLKPVYAEDWREKNHWELVGRRKAIAVSSCEELMAEYVSISGTATPVLVQEVVPGGDQDLWIAACCLSRESKFLAGFTAQKLLQVPPGFGTGCMVRTADRPDLLRRAAQLLEDLGFSGIAEVEFKRDASTGEDKLIEINPRPWDQHRLGAACGVDVIYAAYCDLAGIPLPAFGKQKTGQTWIAEDVYPLVLLRSLWKGDGRFGELLRLARGERIYPISFIRDPLPLLSFLGLRLLPDLAGMLPHVFRSQTRPQATAKGVEIEKPVL
jgi:D-aspartate ligase